MSSNNSRWELWGAITINASSTVTEARTVTSQTGKFNESRGATGISRVQTGVWIVRLRTAEGVSAPQCYALATPRHTQVASGTAALASGGITIAVNHDSAIAKRVTIMQVAREASGAAQNFVNVPFDLALFRRTL